MASFLRAVVLGATAVELDVHVSADGVPVVHHDPALKSQVTPPQFAGAALAGLSSRDLGAVRLAGGDRVPTLREVLDALTPATRVYVEIKGGAPAVIATVVEPFGDSIAVHSFDHDVIAEMARIAPGIRRGILIDRPTDDPSALVARTGATDVWPAFTLVDQAFMDQANRCGVRVIPWTVNSAGEVERLVELGVAGICTNDLALLAT